MKRFYFLLLTACCSLVVFADGLTATLQHGETMTAYFGQSALTAAYEAAEDGDVITLSPGGFNPVTDISKSIRIVGAYGITSSASLTTYLNAAFAINANNVKLEGLYFQSNVTLGTITNCTIKRCWIISLNQSGTHTNTLIDQCVLLRDYAIETGVNYGIKNTTMDGFFAMNTAANVANITNCLIYYFNSASSTAYKQPFAIYKNNILQIHNSGNTNSTSINPVPLSSPSEFYYNFFNSVDYNSYYSSGTRKYYYAIASFNAGCINIGTMYNVLNQGVSTIYSSAITGSSYPNHSACSKSGEDGTPLGITGGEGFNAYPGIPRILTSTIDAQTDDKGKLNASITVQAEE